MPPANQRHALVRWGLAVGGAGLVAAALWLAHGRTAAQQDLLAEAGRLGTLTRNPGLEGAIRRELDPQRSRLALAQALLSDELDRRWTSSLSATERQREAAAGLMRLDRAVELARQILASHPASWRAAMILGGARYLRQARERDSRPWSDPGSWEGPLRAAAALAPGLPEPPRLLALARLDGWFAESDAERDETRALVRLGLRDPVTFQLLLGPWLRSARDPAEALAALPAEPAPLLAARDAYGAAGDWNGYLAAEAARLELLPGLLTARLEHAIAENDAGRGRRDEFLTIAADAPPTSRYAGLVARAIVSAPPGPTTEALRKPLYQWLRWAIEASARGTTAFSPAAVGRLTAAVGDLAPAEEALAALVAGDLPEAERLERLATGVNTDDWAPYLVAKAAALAEREPETAQRAIDRVRGGGRGARYWMALEAVASARRDDAAAAQARAGLQAMTAREWPATAWRYLGGEARLEMVTSQAAQGLIVEWSQPPLRGGCVEVRLDGDSLGTFAIERDAAVHLRLAIAAGPHLLEIVQRAGDRALPGIVRLTD